MAYLHIYSTVQLLQIDFINAFNSNKYNLFILFLDRTSDLLHTTSMILSTAKFLISDFEKVFNKEFIPLCAVKSCTSCKECRIRKVD